MISKREVLNARFIGTNGSMGLIKDKVYQIFILYKKDYIWVFLDAKSNQGCPYSSLSSFLDNWEKI